ncbi:MAG: heme ABC transporter ATP-binding protein [Sorangium cellulosum]|nr:MAG: heme ABC transporter ATP-binding protein [Sorangium cellulosum]
MPSPTLHLDNVTRRFGAVVAVRNASAQFFDGQIHAIVGENGAGKSTLLGLGGGTLRANEGRVLIHGDELTPATPSEAIGRGIGFVHQHFMLVEAFTALENILLGAEPTRSWNRLDFNRGRRAAERKRDELKLDLDLNVQTSSLGVGQRQNLEILRVLVRGAHTILLDEPTAVLTPGQALGLYRTLRRMADQNACIVVVTHRLDEVLEHCDQVTVMRKGSIVSHHVVAQVSSRSLTRDIMGKEPLPPINRPKAPTDPGVSLEVRDLKVAGCVAGKLAVDNLTLTIPKGRIVGLAGIEGNGQQELVRAIAGLLSPLAGKIMLEGQNVTVMNVSERRKAGLSVVHDDRHREGLMLDESVSDNLVMGDLTSVCNEEAWVARRMKLYGIVPHDASLDVRALSGGNQQKVVVARALDRQVRAAVLAQPTRGVDMGAARSIHEAICDVAEAGAGVLIVSADLGELRALCHEIKVLVRGKIVATLGPEASELEFGQAMLGKGQERALEAGA